MSGDGGSPCCDWRREFISPKPFAFTSASGSGAWDRSELTGTIRSARFTRCASSDRQLAQALRKRRRSLRIDSAVRKMEHVRSLLLFSAVMTILAAPSKLLPFLGGRAGGTLRARALSGKLARADPFCPPRTAADRGRTAQQVSPTLGVLRRGLVRSGHPGARHRRRRVAPGAMAGRVIVFPRVLGGRGSHACSR